MEKKNLLNLLPAGYQPTDPCLHSSKFQTTEGDQTSTKTVQLFEKYIIIFSNAVRIEPWAKIAFSFDLIFEVLRDPPKESENQTTLGAVKGFKFEYGQEHCELYTTNEATIKIWREVLTKRLNQRGFHQLFKPIKKIGKGNFASVFLGIRLEDNKKFAIKAFNKEATYSEDKGKESLINQIELNRKLDHNNLMRIVEVYESVNSIYVIVELLEGGQLYDKVKAKYKFTSEEVRTAINGLLKGLEHMHQKKFMHRDLKPENILLRKEGDYDCVIADFGLSTWADEPQYLFVRCGTPGYVAPEIVNLKDLKAKCDPICDIFSLGIIFHILLTGKSPFPGKTYNDVLAQNRQCNINFETEECKKLPPITLDLLKKMLEKEPQKRISAKEALKHPYILSAADHQITSIKEDFASSNKKEHNNKTSIVVGLDSPLMTTCNPLRKNGEMLKDDSCLKFKMKETMISCKQDEQLDSPAAKKISVNVHNQSRFGQEKKLLEKRDVNQY